MDEGLTNEAINYLQDVQLQLAEDIILLKGKVEETMTSLLELTKLPLLRERPKFWFLVKRLNGIGERLRRQRGEFLQYEQAEFELKRENPEVTIKILTELADQNFSVWDVMVDRDNFIIPVQGTLNPPKRFQRLKEFVKKFYSSQQNDSLD